MKKCVVFTNCQGHGMAYFLRKMGFPYQIDIIENYRVFPGEPNEKKLHEAVRVCDLLIVNLTRAAKWLNVSGEYLVSDVVPKSAQVIRVPYVYNHGQHPLCRRDSVMDPRKEYFGEDEIRDYLKARTISEIFHRYRVGAINFHLSSRFMNCLEEQRRREEQCDVKLAEFMWAHRDERLMLTFNHPTSLVLLEAANQIMRLTGNTPVPYAIKDENEVGLPNSEPLSRYVIEHFHMKRTEEAGAGPTYMKRLQEAYLRARAS